MRLIDADALQKEYMYEYDGKRLMLIDTAPTIEERKKGRWIDGQCSICGCDIPAYIIDWKWQKDMDANFCPNCGAKMEQEGKG